MTLGQAVSSGYGGEILFDGVVATAPAFARTTSGVHERFHVRSDDGIDVEIADNVSIAPPCPVRPGDRVEIRGELVRSYRDGSPLVHWTHHDPSGRHTGGFIEVGGRCYA